MLDIIKGCDPIKIAYLINLIYGQPGIGKSSLAFTAKKPLCFDFDNGAYRSQFRQDIVPITSWQQVVNFTADDLKNYDTIIIDTLGRCLDYLTTDIVRQDRKMARRDGNLTMQGWGALKMSFVRWMKNLRDMNKDIILIAHEKEIKDGDNMDVRPDIAGGSYNEIMKIVDFVGYYYKEGDNRILNFNPTERNHGKNSAGFPPLIVPEFKAGDDYMAKLIAKEKAALGQSANSQLAAESIVKSYNEKIEKLTDLDAFNAMQTVLRETYKSGQKSASEQIMELLKVKAATLGFEYDAKEKHFTAPQNDLNAPTPEEMEEYKKALVEN